MAINELFPMGLLEQKAIRAYVEAEKAGPQAQIDNLNARATALATQIDNLNAWATALATKLNTDFTAQNQLAAFPLTLDVDYDTNPQA